jgi:hypothetical protein
MNRPPSEALAIARDLQEVVAGLRESLACVEQALALLAAALELEQTTPLLRLVPIRGELPY